MTCPGGLVPASHLSSSAATAETGATRVVGSLEAAGLELVVARSERYLVGHRLAQIGEVRVVVGVGLDIRQNVERLGDRKSGVPEKSGFVRDDLGGRGSIKKT